MLRLPHAHTDPRRATRPADGRIAALVLIASLLIGPALVTGGCASLGTPAAPPLAAIDPPFFRIEAGDGRVMHILGSIHLGPSEGWALPDHVEREFAAARMLVFEVPEIDAFASASLLVELARYPSGRSLRSELGDQLNDRLEARFRELGGSLRMLQGFEPWVATLELVRLQFAAAGFEAATGVEMQLMRRHDDAGKHAPPRVGLETMEQQLRLLDSMSPELQALGLRSTLEDQAEVDALVRALAEAWRTGNDDALAALLHEANEEYPELASFNEQLFQQRNHRMATRLDSLFAQGDGQFVTIGAGHVVGPESVPQLLGERGYRVERLHTGPLARPARQDAASR